MYLCGCGHHFMPATAIFRKYNFFKKASKIQEILKKSFFCISSGNFYGLSNCILFVFILAVIFEIFKIFDLP